MPNDTETLGQCPTCGERVPSALCLIKYEQNDGSEAVWAECPACEDVVAPE
ncbi:DUF7837 family putative zinc-binding protein [Haloarcula laminariae]